RSAATAAEVPHRLNRAGSMWTLFFTGTPVVDLATAKTSDVARFGRFFWAMIDRGVYLPCSQFEAAFLSAAHTDAMIAGGGAAAGGALPAIMKGGAGGGGAPGHRCRVRALQRGTRGPPAPRPPGSYRTLTRHRPSATGRLPPAPV